MLSDAICETGEKTIDAHHRHLAAMIDRAVSVIATGGVSDADAEALVVEIETYADAHFAYEEKVIDRLCPASVSKANRDGHAYFRTRLVGLRAMKGFEPAISTYVSALTLLRNWFDGHVCNVDCRLRDFIR